MPAIRTIFFDTFGTVVNWRPTVTQALHDAAQRALSAPADQNRLTPSSRAQVAAMSQADWDAVATEWRASYKQFTQTYSGPAATATTTTGGGDGRGFVTVDQHHYEALQRILTARGVAGVFPGREEERWELVFAWHRLEPWADSVRGLQQLNELGFMTSTLSNGNVALLQDLVRLGGLPFQEILSAEHFGAYKPAPEVYQGAARHFGLEPAECAMVAAHLGDLAGAKKQGFRTVYVQREGEEVSEDEAARARKEGVVDEWIGAGQGGLEAVGRRLQA